MIKINESATNNTIVLDNDNPAVLASMIGVQLQGEWDAISGYDKLIPWLEKYNDQESIDQIREIISDEKNHSDMLKKMISKYDGNIPTAED